MACVREALLEHLAQEHKDLPMHVVSVDEHGNSVTRTVDELADMEEKLRGVLEAKSGESALEAARRVKYVCDAAVESDGKVREILGASDGETTEAAATRVSEERDAQNIGYLERVKEVVGAGPREIVYQAACRMRDDLEKATADAGRALARVAELERGREVDVVQVARVANGFEVSKRVVRWHKEVLDFAAQLQARIAECAHWVVLSDVGRELLVRVEAARLGMAGSIRNG
jgi:hypothetical protein